MPNFDRFLCIILVFLCIKNGMLVYVKVFSLSEMPEFCLKNPLPDIPKWSFVPRTKLLNSQNLNFGCEMNENELNLNNSTHQEHNSNYESQYCYFTENPKFVDGHTSAGLHFELNTCKLISNKQTVKNGLFNSTIESIRSYDTILKIFFLGGACGVLTAPLIAGRIGRQPSYLYFGAGILLTKMIKIIVVRKNFFWRFLLTEFYDGFFVFGDLYTCRLLFKELISTKFNFLSDVLSCSGVSVGMVLVTITSKVFSSSLEMVLILIIVIILTYFLYLLPPESGVYLRRVYEDRKARVFEQKIALFNSRNEDKYLKHGYYENVIPIRNEHRFENSGRFKNESWIKLSFLRIGSSLPPVSVNLVCITSIYPVLFFLNTDLNFNEYTTFSVYNQLVIFGACEISAQLIFLLFTLNHKHLNTVKTKFRMVISFFLCLAAGSILLMIYINDEAQVLPFSDLVGNTLHLVLKLSLSMVLILVDFIADHLFKSVERNSVTVLRTFSGVFSLFFLKDFPEFIAGFWSMLSKSLRTAVAPCVLLLVISMVFCLQPVDVRKKENREEIVIVDNVYKKVLVSAKTAPVGLGRKKVKFVRSFSIV